MKVNVLAAALKEQGYDIPEDVLENIKTDYKTSALAIIEHKEKNFVELVAWLKDTHKDILERFNDQAFLPGTAFCIRGRVSDDSVSVVTVENAHSTGTKKPIHIGQEGEIVDTPERNKRDYGEVAS
tara:strand:+ start:164 stop:541 length:378 start_codon:yes stop_codon:yes gene_type:complete